MRGIIANNSITVFSGLLISILASKLPCSSPVLPRRPLQLNHPPSFVWRQIITLRHLQNRRQSYYVGRSCLFYSPTVTPQRSCQYLDRRQIFNKGGFVQEARSRPDKRKTTAAVESIQSIRPIGMIQGAEESKVEIPAELHLRTAFTKPGLRPS